VARGALSDVARALRDLEPHGIAAQAVAQHLAHGVDQVLFLLVVGREIGVARDAKRDRLLDLVAREQFMQVLARRILDQDESLARRFRSVDAPAPAHLDPAGPAARKLDDGEPLLFTVAREAHREVERQVVKARERKLGIDRGGTQHREDLAGEKAIHEGALAGLQLGRPHDADAAVHQPGRDSLLPEEMGRGHQIARDRLHRSHVFRGRHAGGRAVLHARANPIADRRDADHEELVQVREEDAEEARPFENGTLRVLRLFEHATIEREPGQRAVEVAAFSCRGVRQGVL
jgi:hypothetical protein